MKNIYDYFALVMALLNICFWGYFFIYKKEAIKSDSQNIKIGGLLLIICYFASLSMAIKL